MITPQLRLPLWGAPPAARTAMPRSLAAAARPPLLVLMCAQAMLVGVAAQAFGAKVTLPQTYPLRFFVVGDWGRANDE